MYILEKKRWEKPGNIHFKPSSPILQENGGNVIGNV
jgi:hypothetical protein